MEEHNAGAFSVAPLVKHHAHGTGSTTGSRSPVHSGDLYLTTVLSEPVQGAQTRDYCMGHCLSCDPLYTASFGISIEL